MKRKRALYGALAVLLVVAGATLWPRPFSSRGNESPGLHETPVAADPSGFLRDSPSLAPGEARSLAEATQSPEKPIEAPSAAQVYGDTSISLGERFRLLLGAGEGDQAAAHLALGIVSGCHSIDAIPSGTPPLGAEVATDYQLSLDKLLRQECRDVLSNPDYQKTLGVLKKHSAHMYADSVKRAIREQYAAGGAPAALIAGVGALKSRPDQVTANVVADQLSELEISSVYLAPLMRSAESVTPQNRNLLVNAAIQLLTCDFGRPCGPNSFDVRTMCLVMGVCIPGANLQMLTVQELMTGQQARDVQAILDNLRQYRR